MFDSSQGVHGVVQTLAPVWGLETDQIRVRAPYVGGGFGSKGVAHAHVMAAALAARTTEGRPVRLAVTRQQMFDLTGYRTATIQHVRIGAAADGPDRNSVVEGKGAYVRVGTGGRRINK